MSKEGYVRLYRSFLRWEWYDDVNCRLVFLHLLLTVNWDDKKWHGIQVKKGQRIVSTVKLAKEVGISRSALMRAMDKLKSTGDIETLSDNQRTTVTLVNWESYQVDTLRTGQRTNSKRTANDTTNGQRMDSQPDSGILRPSSQNDETRTAPRTADGQPTGQPVNDKADTTKEGEELKKERTTNVVPKGGVELNWPAWAGPQTRTKWEAFKVYQLESHKFRYKSASSEQAAITLLAKYFNNGRDCVAALDEAMGRGWKFPVDPAKQETKFGAPAPVAPQPIKQGWRNG